MTTSARRAARLAPTAPGGVVEGGSVSAHEFRDDDVGYLAWLAAHADGCVLNIARSHSATGARAHRAGCRTMIPNARGGSWTGPYVKVCADNWAELERWWATEHMDAPIPSCSICRANRPTETVEHHGLNTTTTGRAAGGAVPGRRYATHGPSAGYPVVEVWVDDHIRFPPRPAWQEDLRGEIVAYCSQLEPLAGQVLSATFSGPKPGDADVENFALYNVDAFKTCASNGIRFEHGSTVPAAPGGAEYRFHYRYALEQRSGTFGHWQIGRTVASFDWTDLGALIGDITSAKVWWALARRESYVAEQVLAPQTPFAVTLEVRAPRSGRQPRPDLLLKPIFDGAISAFQAHTDTAVVADVASRLATVLPAPSTEIERYLLDHRRAVLGEVPQLVRPQRKAGVWNPADHLCVAGELLPAEPTGSCWAIRGRIVEAWR